MPRDGLRILTRIKAHTHGGWGMRRFSGRFMRAAEELDGKSRDANQTAQIHQILLYVFRQVGPG